MPDHRFLELKPKELFGEDAILTHLTGVEEISGDYQFTLTIYSPKDKIKPEDVIGKPLKVRMDRGDKDPRYFHGYINAFSAGNSVSTTLRSTVYRIYRVQIVSWLWFMTRSSRCHIYLPEEETKSIEKVLKDLVDLVKDYKHVQPEIKFGENTLLSKAKVEHCVQYRETDYAFFSRLLERYGARYHFESSEEKLEVVVSDNSNYPKAVEYEVAYPSSVDDRAHHDSITSWQHEFEFVSGKIELNDFDFTNPTQTIQCRSFAHSSIKLNGNTAYGLHEYPGQFLNRSIGDDIATCRLEEEEAKYDRVSGTSTCKTFMAGYRFKLTDHPTSPDEKGKSYLLTAVQHEASQPGPFTSDETAVGYSNSFECCSSERNFRPRSKTPIPVVPGVQTAIVVGKGGNEIWTDQYGRVKVRFHWDRSSSDGEFASCWVRVSQNHAGMSFGGIDIPRIGEEVIVSFVDGDIDRPLITGRVYNGTHSPPYRLPDKSQISGYKSQTIGGGGYNEFSMNDESGKELILLHAHKDFTATANEQIKLTSEKSTITLEGKEEIVLKSGSASITLKKDGTIHIKGMTINITGDKDVKLEATNINSNGHVENKVQGTNVSVSATAITEVSGALVKIN